MIVDTMTDARRTETRPVVPVPTPRLVVLERPQSPSPTVSGVRAPTGGHRLAGPASWYCKAGVSKCMAVHPDGPGVDAYAAAGPRLRAAICGRQDCTSWRGRVVSVCSATRCLATRLSDWCQCLWRQSSEKVVDLYWDVWNYLGVKTSVTISW